MTSFKRLTPVNDSAKDSCSFTHNGKNYMLCTNCNQGGIMVFVEESKDKYIPYDTLFKGWIWLWAPTIFKENGSVFVYFSDTAGRTANDTVSAANVSRMFIAEYSVETKFWSDPTPVLIGDDSFGVIDPYVKYINGIYYMLFVNVKRYVIKKYVKWLPEFLAKLFKLYDEDIKHWDIYYATSNKKQGPFVNPKLLVSPEAIVEEAPFWPEGDYIYWSEEPSDRGSYIKRGTVVIDNGKLFLRRDPNYKLQWDKTITTTHPDFFNGKIRATLKSEDSLFYIGEEV